MLYKFIDETRVLNCPKNGIIDGKAISNLPRYLGIHPHLAEKEGYKPLVVDEVPSHDETTQCVVPRYENNEQHITCHWEIHDFSTDIE